MNKNVEFVGISKKEQEFVVSMKALLVRYNVELSGDIDFDFPSLVSKDGEINLNFGTLIYLLQDNS